VTLPADGTRVQQVRTLVSEAEVEDLDDECTVLRVIGEYSYFLEDDASRNRPVSIVAGMLVRESLDVGVQPDLLDPEDIEEYPLSWLKTWICLPDGVSRQSQAGCNDAFTVSTALEKIDVRVKRKLRSGDELYFNVSSHFVSYGANALPANGTINMHSWLRVRILIEA